MATATTAALLGHAMATATTCLRTATGTFRCGAPVTDIFYSEVRYGQPPMTIGSYVVSPIYLLWGTRFGVQGTSSRKSRKTDWHFYG